MEQKLQRQERKANQPMRIDDAERWLVELCQAAIDVDGTHQTQDRLRAAVRKIECAGGITCVLKFCGIENQAELAEQDEREADSEIFDESDFESYY